MTRIKMKPFAAVVTAILLLWSCMAGFAAEAKTGRCGERLTWTLDRTGLLTISGSGDMENYEESPWKDARVKAVAIGSGVTGIGAKAFSGCGELASVSIPDGVTFIGRSAFENCRALTSATLPDSVDVIGENAFLGCESLRYLRLPLELRSLGSYAFCGCGSLVSIAIPRGLGAVEFGCFAYCGNLRAVYVPEDVHTFCFDVFKGCVGLEKLVICSPDVDAIMIFEETPMDEPPAQAPASPVVYGPSGSSLERHVLDMGWTFRELGTDDRLTGDLDGDCAVTASDARLALRAAVGLSAAGEREPLADANFDGDLTAEDARIILREAVGLEIPV